MFKTLKKKKKRGEREKEEKKGGKKERDEKQGQKQLRVCGRKWRKSKRCRKNGGHRKGKKTKRLAGPQHDWNIVKFRLQ